MAEEFNKYFTSVASTIASEIIPYSDGKGSCISPHVDSIFSFHDNTLEISDIYDAIKSLEPKKTLDANGLSVFFISKIAPDIAKHLHHIFKTSMLTGIVPTQLKIAKVIPVFKSGDKTQMDNYRPISLLNVFSKVFEKIISSRLS